MLARRVVRRSALTLVASSALYAGACSSEPDPSEPAASADPELEGVVYLGATNHEGLEVLLAAKPTRGDPPVIIAPEEGAVLESRTTFHFERGLSARRDARPGPPHWRTFSLRELLGPERAAHAHGLPMNGAAFLLTFGTSEDPHLLRVFTDETSYEPSDEAWAALAGAREITLTLRMGLFEEGRLPSGAGPFESAALHFSVSGS
jgi:hypothetical protein